MSTILRFSQRYYARLQTLSTQAFELIMLSFAVLIFSSPYALAASSANDALVTRVESELGNFTSWLSINNAKGYIGEIGWPDNVMGDSNSWNSLAEAWYQKADASKLWVTAWATGAWWHTTYNLGIYEDGGSGVNIADTQSQVLEAHGSTSGYSRGVNVSGAEFSTGGNFSNANPGTYGGTYTYDPPQTFTYLASRGIRIVRLPFRWERIQPNLNAPLEPNELARLKSTVEAARIAGLKVILDIHNYGEYYTSAGRQYISSANLPQADFVDLWQRLSQEFQGNTGIAAYGLMNEPHDMPSNDRSSAKHWEQISQAALSGIRSRGDNTLIMVPGYSYSGVQGWTYFHPVSWINDPAYNFRYEAHQYFDRDGSGVYTDTYVSEVSDALSRGYKASSNPSIAPATIPAASSNTAAAALKTTAPPTSVPSVSPISSDSTSPRTSVSKTKPTSPVLRDASSPLSSHPKILKTSRVFAWAGAGIGLTILIGLMVLGVFSHLHILTLRNTSQKT